MKYRVGQKVEAKVHAEFILRGRIINVSGGEYEIDWGDMGIYSYPFNLIDKPNKVNNIFVMKDELPEELFTL